MTYFSSFAVERIGNAFVAAVCFFIDKRTGTRKGAFCSFIMGIPLSACSLTRNDRGGGLPLGHSEPFYGKESPMCSANSHVADAGVGAINVGAFHETPLPITSLCSSPRHANSFSRR